MTSEKIKFLILRTIGNFLILTSIFGMMATFGPVLKNEIIFKLNRLRGVIYVLKGDKIPQSNKRGFFADLLGGPKTQILVPVSTDFSIVIPKIAANAPIIPNIDASNYKEYMQALSKGVAHAKGTVLPGMEGNIFLFAHSTDNFWNVGRYNAVFYLLKELEIGDEVNIFFGGRRFIYQVYEKKIVEANEVGYLSPKAEGQVLTLQTCWPPGTTLKRLLVFAKAKNSNGD